MASKVQLTGGAFQDAEGNLLTNGYLIFHLSQDGSVAGVGNICSGVEIKINLNASGSVDTGTPQYLWGNDQILPVNTFYRVTGYTAQGQPAWGPNNQQVIGNGGTFDVGTWVPNQVFSWSPTPTSLVLKTNGILNNSQAILNLLAGTNVVLTDQGGGTVKIDASGAGIALKTNGIANGSQAILNLIQSGAVTLTDNGVGGVTIAVPASVLAGSGIGMPLTQAHNSIPTGSAITLNQTGMAMTGLGGNTGNWFPSSSENLAVFSVDAFSGSAVGCVGWGDTDKFMSLAGFTSAQIRALFTNVRTTSTLWVGVTDQTISQGPMNSAFGTTGIPSGNFAGFRFNAGTDTYWKILTSNGVTNTVVTTSIVPTSANSSNFEIRQATPGVLTFVIDGVIAGTISTNIPTARVGLMAMLYDGTYYSSTTPTASYLSAGWN